MTTADLVERLLRKADQDRHAAHVLAADPDTSDEAIGFHAQLASTIRAQGVDFPEDLEEVFDLGPFAVALRYDDLFIEAEEPFDRTWALACIDRARAWARAALARPRARE